MCTSRNRAISQGTFLGHKDFICCRYNHLRPVATGRSGKSSRGWPGLMLEKAVRICDAAFGNIFRWDGSTLQLIAGHKTPPAFAEARRRLPVEITPSSPIGRMIRTKAAVHIADLACEQLYIERFPALVAAVELGVVRT